MSAWYIYNALGFYPVNPASGEYMIGSPMFDKVEVTFPPSPASTKIASKLTITAAGAADNAFVRGVNLNGKSLQSPVVTHQQIMGAMSLAFDLRSDPQNWSVGVL
jgi:putative alpha-1,2-mannosidase